MEVSHADFEALDPVAASLIETPEAPDGDEPEVDEEAATPDIAEDEDQEGDIEGDDEPEGDDDTDIEKETITVLVDGEERAVSVDDLKAAYAKQAYVDQGIQSNAEAKKGLENLHAQVSRGGQEFAQLYQLMMSGQLALPPQAPDPNIANSDPVRYARERAAYDRKVSEFQNQQAHIQQVFQRQQAATQQAQQAQMAEQMRELVAYLPDLADPQKGAAVRDSLLSAGSAYGYSAEEIGKVMDSRALRVLHDAAQWRKLQSGKAAVTEKAAKARPVVKPKAQKQNGKRKAEEAAMNKARRTGSVEDIAASLIIQAS